MFIEGVSFSFVVGFYVVVEFKGAVWICIGLGSVCDPSNCLCGLSRFVFWVKLYLGLF